MITLIATTSGIVEESSVKIEPNRICCAAPVVAFLVVSRYKNSAASPVAKPSTMPVAISRPRRRCTPTSSMAPAPSTPAPRKPTRGLRLKKKAPEPPVVATSVRAWPAKDWPRITVKTPTMADTTALTAPTTSATCTGPLEKNPGSKR